MIVLYKTGKGGNFMIKTWTKPDRPNEESMKQRWDEKKKLLSAQQMKLKNHKLPVIVLMEGWGASGKGSTIRSIIDNLDPRFFKVTSMGKPTEEDQRRPFLYRYFQEIPENGQFTFFNSGWGSELVDKRVHGELSDEEYVKRIDSVKRFERQLTDNGYAVVKLFMQVSHKEQKARLDALEENKDTRWRVSEKDRWQNKHYDQYMDVFNQYLIDTNVSVAPWHIIDAKNKKWAKLQVIEILCDAINTALQNEHIAVPISQNVFPLVPMPKLADVSFADAKMPQEEYKQKLDELQKKLSQLHYRLYRKKIPVIIAYEGWDAAGKGGNIKRIAAALDPRGYKVYPIASPEPHEKNRHFLWRFWTRLPKSGHIAIFDRTWYGRVMVERLEGFCSTNDWQRAYNEINEFEKELTDWGAIVIKFWVHIDKDTQLQRFTDRQNNPDKQWKITDEDWRNREKWDDYEVAIDEMIAKTSTAFAPWHILESVDKNYARIKALEIVIDEIEKRI